jgi:hypothetical protein
MTSPAYSMMVIDLAVAFALLFLNLSEAPGQAVGTPADPEKARRDSQMALFAVCALLMTNACVFLLLMTAKMKP